MKILEEPSGIYTGVNLDPKKDFVRPPLVGLAKTLKSGLNDSGVIEPCICASRGRNPDNPSDRTAGTETEQRLEINEQGTSNTLTSVQKDNLVVMPTYRIRKLTPLECIRLMNFDDSDYDKIKAVGMADSQIYKQCGNSIVVACLEGIFRKMFIGTEVENEQLSFF